MIVYIYIYIQTGYLSVFAPDWSQIANPDSFLKKRKRALTNSAPKRYHNRRRRKPGAAFRDSLSQNANPINRLSGQNVLRMSAKRDHADIECFTPDVSRRGEIGQGFQNGPPPASILGAAHDFPAKTSSLSSTFTLAPLPPFRYNVRVETALKRRDAALPFTMAFAYEIALGFDPPHEVCRRHNVAESHFARLESYEPFIQAKAALYEQFLKSGMTLDLKAKLALESVLPQAAIIASDEAFDAATRIKAMELLSKVANVGAGPSGPEKPTFAFQVVIGDPGRPISLSAAAQALPDDIFEIHDA